MKPWLSWCLLLFPALCWGAQGILDTLDGSRYRGEIQLSETGLVVLNAAATNQVALTNLAVLRLQAKSAEATPRSPADMPTNGWLGLYFNTPDLTGPFQVRYDPVVNFDWGKDSPMPGVKGDGFSVRWLGTLLPESTENYLFHAITDDGVRLWANQRLLIDAWKEEFCNVSSNPVWLHAGQPCEVQIEMFDARGRGMAKLFWSRTGQGRELLPARHVRPAPVPDLVAPETSRKLSAGLLLAGGSLLAGKIKKADQSSIVVDQEGKFRSFSTLQVARLLLQGIAPELLAKIPSGRSGVLLNNHEFVEGEFMGFNFTGVHLNSILLGPKTFEPHKVVAVALRDVRTAPARYEIETRDGSRLAVDRLHLEKSGFKVQAPGLGDMIIPLADLLQARRSL